MAERLLWPRRTAICVWPRLSNLKIAQHYFSGQRWDCFVVPWSMQIKFGIPALVGDITVWPQPRNPAILCLAIFVDIGTSWKGSVCIMVIVKCKADLFKAKCRQCRRLVAIACWIAGMARLGNTMQHPVTMANEAGARTGTIAAASAFAAVAGFEPANIKLIIPVAGWSIDGPYYSIMQSGKTF